MFLKVVCLVVLLCSIQEAVASCIQYGHACWGGHGKRAETDGTKMENGGEWFLTRVISPAEAAKVFNEEEPL